MSRRYVELERFGKVHPVVESVHIEEDALMHLVVVEKRSIGHNSLLLNADELSN
jgi:hypothetical protein